MTIMTVNEFIDEFDNANDQTKVGMWNALMCSKDMQMILIIHKHENHRITFEVLKIVGHIRDNGDKGPYGTKLETIKLTEDS